MTRRWASVLPLVLASLLVAGCDRMRAKPDGAATPWFEILAAGAFLPRYPWLEVAELYRSTRAEEFQGEAWQVPYGRWLKVEDGWGGPEDWGAWALGKRTRLHFFLQAAGPYDFCVTAMGPPDPANRPQEVTVRINGEKAGAFTPGSDWGRHRLSLREEILRPGWNDLELRYAYHLDGSMENDDRLLALGIERLGLVPPDREPATAETGPGVRLYRDQEVLVLEAPGTYVVPIDVPGNGLSLDFEVGTSRGADMAGLEVGVMTLDGRKSSRAALSEAGGTSHLDLADHRGTQVLLVIEADLLEGGRFTIRRPEIVVGDAADEDRAERTSTDAAATPPVVLIVLDAARADHFGVYGYERDTTPHIDRLAAESLVFRNVVAECSYTVCSMPSLLAGLSYVQHGLVSKKLVLKDQVTTLAELLQRAGYFTLGYTGNPNNSTVTGTHQGFDEFYEVWETHPKHITSQVTERLSRGDVGERPLFLMLHYVPPHEPYAPDPEFDVFGDPAYDGPVTSDREFTRDVYARKITLDEADLAEMVSLYDGNLRMGDATVKRILDLLKESGTYDDAIVVVTSDHGEAFLEHGRVGHNTTIYEEMLRVPLIVKLPKGWEGRAARVNLERLVTLADVPVTILGLLGIRPPEEMRAYDLLAAGRDVPERWIYLRSAHATKPILGVRTNRFKALAQTGRPPELYDLASDPAEEVNLIGDQAVLHTGLSLILARAIRDPGELRAGAREGEVSEKDQAMLRALGYL